MSVCRTCVVALFVFAGLPAWGQFDGNIAARAIYKQGEKALSNGSYADAVADYQKAISLDPNFAEAYQQYIFPSTIFSITGAGLPVCAAWAR